ncbi:MAG: HAMP domain-containing histidine kinase, partial [Caldisericaceae bacterium]|nr:HAMP domain-containing histidine kinase [Caldisericaceae bacterium]
FALLLFGEYEGLLPHYPIFNTQLHQNLSAIGLTLTVFVITVYFTTYICLTFMELYRHSKQVIDQQNEELRRASEHRLQFFRFASHELKSPVVAIKSTIDSVLDNFGKDINPAGVDLLKRASMRSEQMLAIIKDLLELSRPRPKPDKQSIKEVNVNQLLDEVIAQEGVLAAEKGINLILSVDFDNLKIAIPKEDLEKVFRNLVNNAIRYTPEKGMVKVKAMNEKSTLIVEVQDTGIGIAAKDLDNIFNEFYRAENAKKMVSTGTGLGLSLVKKIVEEYGGKIEVESKINEGSIFRIKLPIETN